MRHSSRARTRGGKAPSQLLAVNHDAERAVRAGLEVITAVAGLKTRAPLQARIGIATGVVVVGDLIGTGSAHEQRYAFVLSRLLLAKLPPVARTAGIADCVRKLQRGVRRPRARRTACASSRASCCRRSSRISRVADSALYAIRIVDQRDVPFSTAMSLIHSGDVALYTTRPGRIIGLPDASCRRARGQTLRARHWHVQARLAAGPSPC
jgi:hypothetical protein